MLAETGLYSDVANKTLADGIRAYAPQYELWTDGAVKNRWMYIPECAQIDTADMDAWQMPVGATTFKEFVVDGKRIETRMVHRHGPGANDYVFASYQWNAGETAATRVPNGVENAAPNGHDIPSEMECLQCHGRGLPGAGGMPGRMLGVGAIQLSHTQTATSLADLIAEDLLSDPPAVDSFPVPGDATDQAALGMLHANCGHCHNHTPSTISLVDMKLALRTTDLAVSDTNAYKTAVGVALSMFQDPDPNNPPNLVNRIEPGNHEDSGVYYRMTQRGGNAQMPPLGTEQRYTAGEMALAKWIDENLP